MEVGDRDIFILSLHETFSYNKIDCCLMLYNSNNKATAKLRTNHTGVAAHIDPPPNIPRVEVG